MFLKIGKLKKAALWVVCLFSMTCFAACAVEKGKVYVKDGKSYGTTGGLFKSEWDDYYLRGLSYGEGEYWEDAARDFAVAIQKRENDQRRARTYGMHFIDYFPNRELGIAYYNMKRYSDAIQALEVSLEQVESARAKFYLDKARKAWLDESKLDTAAPGISVDFPPTEYRTSDFSIAVKGRANDDFFVSNIVFNGQPSKLELSQKEVSFQEEFLLRHGKNVIVLQSEDILGKTSSPLTIHVKVDREGPLVFLEVRETGHNTISVTGAVYDKSAVAGLTLNSRPLAFKETNFLKVEEQFNRAELKKDDFLQFEAEDVIGNKTSGCLNCDTGGYSPSSLSINSSSQVAFNKYVTGEHAFGIDLRGLRDGLSMYLETLTVEGTVQSLEGIEDFTVNRESLLSLEKSPSGARFLKLLREKRGRSLTFSKTIQLQEGNNSITTTLTDAAGAVTGKEVAIVRNIPKVKQLASRLSVSIFPFTDTKKTGSETRNYIHTFLNRSFQEQKRFNVLGRDKLNNVLEDLRVSRETVFNEDKAIRLGRLMDADTVLVGDIAVSKGSVEITAHLFDTQTSSLIAEKDVYWEGELTAGFRGILDRLALKFKDHIPLCEGSVTEILKPRVVIDLGIDRSIHKGMRFLAYREEDPLIDEKTGINLGSDTEVFGLLAAEKVEQTSSQADVVKKFTERGVQTGDKVISK